MRDDLIENLQPPVEVVDKEVLDDIYLSLCAESPDDWKAPEEWGSSEVISRNALASGL